MGKTSSPLLRLESVSAGYGAKDVLKDVSLEVGMGEIVALIGHNGAGKSTVLKVAFGLLPPATGEVTLEGRRFGKPQPVDLLRQGVAFVPQGNRVFSGLTVRENLALGVSHGGRQAVEEALERVGALFPRLLGRMEQRAGSLSGGEKQMLALANALVLAPRLLLLDEPSMGLAPPLVTAALDQVALIRGRFGTTILVVEQKVREVLRITDRLYVLRNGEVVHEGPAAELREDEERLRAVYL